MQSLGLPAPDRGFAWIILMAATVVIMVSAGLMRSFGILYPLIQQKFTTTASQTQWIGGLTSCICMITGPLVTALVLRFGSRVVVIIGAATACLGLVASSFVNDGPVLMVTYSCVVGFGYGLMYSPVLVIVSQYFRIRRGLATSVAAAGSGLGGFIMPLLVTFLDSQFTLSGAFLLMGGFLLNAAVAGSFFTPLDTYWEMQSEEDFKKAEQELLLANEKAQSDDGMKYRKSPSTELPKDSDEDCWLESKCMDNNLKVDENNSTEHRVCGEKKKDEYLAVSTRYSLKGSGSVHSTPTLSRAEAAVGGAMSLESFAFSHLALPSTTGVETDPQTEPQTCACRFLGRRCCKFSKRVKEPALFDFSLLREKVLVIYIVAAGLSYINMTVGNSTLVTFAIENGIPLHRAKVMLSTMSVLNTVFRMAYGWFSDKRLIPVSMLIGIATVIQGILTIIERFCQAEWSLWMFTVVFSAVNGTEISLSSVALVDLMGLERMPNSYGLVSFFMGLAALIGPYFAGYLRDITGDWSVSFYFTGLCGILSGVTLLAEGIVSKRCQQLWSTRRPAKAADI